MEGDEIQGDEPIRPNFDDMLLENQDMPTRIFSPTNLMTPTGAYDDEPQPPTIPTVSRISGQSPIPATIDE